MTDKKFTINHEEIQSLLGQLFDEEDIQTIKEVVQMRVVLLRDPILGNDPISALYPQRDKILPLDNKIGGKGIDVLLFGKGKPLMGDYGGSRNTEIYRPLSYALGRLLFSNPTDPRGSIHMSCEHIENVLKDRLRESTTENVFELNENASEEASYQNRDTRSLGILIREIHNKKLLAQDLVGQLWNINTIFRIAKHEYGIDSVKIEEVESVVESRVFNNLEAMSMYFICRKVGTKLLGGS